ncbi:MAG: SOS response-associated peptidase [Spirochaetes bacterium]|jgi:putative SOS response-associated peptidase YedK|nr:SOS response-associated peptidase [Spirochaetota bacterium]
MMCGRFASAIPTKKIVELYNIDENLTDLPERPEIFPTDRVAAIVLDGRRKLVEFGWGLVPSWAKDPKIGQKMINARAESVQSKPSFRNPFMRQRCLIVATGFYEWKKTGTGKTKVFIRLKSREPFTFAGLYDFWKTPEGKTIGTCTIITTEANDLVASIHDKKRMPVIIKEKDQILWLDCSDYNEQLLLPLLRPYENSEMEALTP